MLHKVLLLLCLHTIAIAATAQANKPITLSSPNGRIIVTVTNTNGKLYYSCNYKGKPILNNSQLGIQFKDDDNQSYVNGIRIKSTSTSKHNETWNTVWGYNAKVVDNYNALTVACTVQGADAGSTYAVEFKAFNEGIAFRYNVKRLQSNNAVASSIGALINTGTNTDYATEIMGEATQFAIAQEGTCYWQPLMKSYCEHFENRHKTTPMAAIDSCNTPMTMKLNSGVHISIHEAALINYSSTVLVNKQGILSSFLAPWADGVAVKLNTNAFTTPWRTIQISDDAAGLINGAQMILNLNAPCAIKNTNWIKPMKFNGVWWQMHLGVRSWYSGAVHGATTANAKKYIDFAAANGLQATLVEGWNTGWETFIGKELFSYTKPYPDYDLPYLAKYAKQKGIQLMSHHETGNNLPDYEKQMVAAYNQMQQLGQHSVKSGYVGDSKVMGDANYWHQGQRMVEHIQLSTVTAAQYQVAIDPHETIKPTGICRTYPNLMSGEGVRGNEYNAWSDGNLPEHETILPFTRGLAGPMDYTPGIFDITFKEGNRRRATGDAQYTEPMTNRIHTTLSKQLALYVCLYSPLQMAADLVENYEGNKAFQFIKDVPVTFDETKVINAAIGDYYVVARRNGSSWYVGGITDENARSLDINFAFLPKGKKYIATMYADSKATDYDTNPTAYEILTMEVTSATRLAYPVAKSGGVAITIKLK